MHETRAHNNDNRPHGWMGIHRGHQARPVEWLAEKGIFLVSLSAILVVLLIFLFVAREASAGRFLARPTPRWFRSRFRTAEMDKAPDGRAPAISGTDAGSNIAPMGKDTLKALMDVKQEAQDEIPEEFRKDPDARINTTEWQYLIQPHQWSQL